MEGGTLLAMLMLLLLSSLAFIFMPLEFVMGGNGNEDAFVLVCIDDVEEGVKMGALKGS